MQDLILVYALYPTMMIYSVSDTENELVLLSENDSSLSFENIFADIAQTANLTVRNAKQSILLHGQSFCISN